LFIAEQIDAQHRRRCALAEATERSMHRRNQSRNLINADTILRHINSGRSVQPG
jgi:hypothetical protein